MPSYNLVPLVEVAGDTAIDTQALPVQVKMQDQYETDRGRLTLLHDGELEGGG